MRERLILFAKCPRLGSVKTRLVPPLRPEQALALYEAFLLDQLRFLAAMASDLRVIELSTDRPWSPGPELAKASAGFETTVQGPGDLGDRMLRAFARSHEAGVSRTVIVGADTPTLPPEHVESAFAGLETGAAAVVAPAEDGGYVLIGMSRPRPELFSGIAWGTPGVLGETRIRARDAGLELDEIDRWYDVDDRRDLERLRIDLERPAVARRAPATSRVLRGIDPTG